MKPILNLFWQICLLRQSPAHVPTQGWFVVTVVVANLVSSVVISSALQPQVGILRTATAIVVMQTITAALIYLALTLSNRGNRFVTTLTAVFGCDLIITAFHALVMPVADALGDAATNVALVVFLIWSAAVVGFILHRALETSLPMGIGLAMAIALMSVTFGQLAIGTPASA